MKKKNCAPADANVLIPLKFWIANLCMSELHDDWKCLIEYMRIHYFPMTTKICSHIVLNMFLCFADITELFRLKGIMA